MKVRWRKRALADLAALRRYIRAGSPRAATRIVQRIRRCIDGLVTFPESFPRVGLGDLRRLVVPQTPYVVYYVISSGEIWVTAIFHARQDRPWDLLSRVPRAH